MNSLRNSLVILHQETESGPAAQSHPSTRAGGQDDVSSNKLPQNIMLRYIIYYKLYLAPLNLYKILIVPAIYLI